MDFFNKLFGSQKIKIERAYKEGIKFYNNNNFLKAIDQFKWVMSKKSLSLENNLAKFYCSQAHRNIGITKFAKAEYEDALYHFNNAQKYNPNHTELSYFIGICLNNTGEFTKAIQYFSKLKELDPENIPNKLKMAIVFNNLGMWENAEAIHRNILEKNPHYADVHFYLGLCLLSASKLSEAAVSFKKALNLNPNYIKAQLKLSIAQAAMGEYRLAFNNLNQIHSKYPDYADVIYLIATVKEDCNEIGQAIQWLLKAVKINGSYKTARIKLITLYCKTGKINDAEKHLKEITYYYPNDNRLETLKKMILKIRQFPQENLFASIDNLLQEEQLQIQLIDEFHKNIDIMPNFSEIIEMFCGSKYSNETAAGMSKVILPFISNHIRKNPNFPDLRNSLGTQLLLCGKNEEAEEAFSTAVELNPDYLTARINLLKTLHKNGKNKEALEHGQYVLKKKLRYPDVYYTVAKVLFALKQYKASLAHAKKSLEIKPDMKDTHLLISHIYKKMDNKDLGHDQPDVGDEASNRQK
ncbi:tetratricopeptide repeat protein [Desulfobacula phenolica]|uniref:Tetratricopeptide repeat-containing protein n=1 Tax=Desulfobacula phenolica TaxID=90732 RepID=A0A1H2DU45_9BACT|nr:tetratricopeptide repeat protein [Desulfobacula phenolica]SDT86370.1 Tetratricopeptide repeat-containing protein [Desulfobacula phenolica]